MMAAKSSVACKRERASVSGQHGICQAKIRVALSSMPDFGSPESKTLSSSQPLLHKYSKRRKKKCAHTHTEIYGLSCRFKKLHAYASIIIVVD